MPRQGEKLLKVVAPVGLEPTTSTFARSALYPPELRGHPCPLDQYMVMISTRRLNPKRLANQAPFNLAR